MMALAMLATTAHALQWPSLASLRGPDNYAEVDASLQATCEDGYTEGVKEAKNMWRTSPNFRDCDNAWSIEDQAEDLKDKFYPEDTRNWRMASFYECARDGVDQEVKNIQERCFNDNTYQCTDVGNVAAEHVVSANFCSLSRIANDEESEPNYKKQCKDVAVSICEGNISNVVDRWCPDQKLTTSKLRDMMGKCEDQVNNMVGTDDDDDDRNNDRDERCGRGGSCGSCKKSSCPSKSERKACKKRNCSLEDLALFFPKNLA